GRDHREVEAHRRGGGAHPGQAAQDRHPGDALRAGLDAVLGQAVRRPVKRGPAEGAGSSLRRFLLPGPGLTRDVTCSELPTGRFDPASRRPTSPSTAVAPSSRLDGSGALRTGTLLTFTRAFIAAGFVPPGAGKLSSVGSMVTE